MKELAEIAKDGLTRLMPEFSRLSELVPKPGPNDSELKSFLLTAAGAALSTLGAISGIGAMACQFAIWGCDFMVLCADKFYDLFNDEATPGRGSEALETIEFESDAEMTGAVDSNSGSAQAQSQTISGRMQNTAATSAGYSYTDFLNLFHNPNSSQSSSAKLEARVIKPQPNAYWTWYVEGFADESAFHLIPDTSDQPGQGFANTATVHGLNECSAFVVAEYHYGVGSKRTFDYNLLPIAVLTRATEPFQAIAYKTKASPIIASKKGEVSLNDGQMVTVEGHIRLGLRDYYYIKQSGKWLFLPWIIRPTHGTPTAVPDLLSFAYGRMGWGYPIADPATQKPDYMARKISASFMKSGYSYGSTTNANHLGFDLIKDRALGYTSDRELVAVANGTIKEVNKVDNGSPVMHSTRGWYIAIETYNVDPNGNRLIVTYQHMKEVPKKRNGTRWEAGNSISRGDYVGVISDSGIPTFTYAGK